MKGSEGKTKMFDFLRLEFLSSFKVFARNHMKRAYLEFIGTLPIFYVAKGVNTLPLCLCCKRCWYFPRVSIARLIWRVENTLSHIISLAGSNYKVLIYIYVLSTRAITCHTCRESGSGPGLLYYN
jgi:hypothetical protein